MRVGAWYPKRHTRHAAAGTRRLLILAGAVILFAGGLATTVAAQARYAFSDVTVAAGINFLHEPVEDPNFWIMGTGAAWFDLDRDGDLDLYVTQGKGPNKLYRNDGSGRFQEIAVDMGAAAPDNGGGGVVVADYNNDGWPDIFLANSGADVLLKNEQGLRFVDVTEASGLGGDEERGSSASWGDFDGDGHLDLYVSNHMNIAGVEHSRRDRLYHNDGKGYFTDVSHVLGEDHLSGYGFIGAFTDYDRDGDSDILLINDCPLFAGYQPTKLFRNDGGEEPASWIFTEVSSQVGADQCMHGMGIAVGDYDGDGWLDYFYTNTSRALLLHNDGGSFSDVTDEAGVAIQPKTSVVYWTWGANFFDYDLDGWLDLHVAAGALTEYHRPVVQRNYLFRNLRDGSFEDVSTFSGVDDEEKGRTSIVGDYDGDGDLDLFLVNGDGRAHLFRNDQETGRHYLIVDLEGMRSNRDGIGARIEAELPDGSVLVHEVRSGSSLGGGDDIRAHFGLGSVTQIKELRIRWPSGIEQAVEDIAMDQVLVITEEIGEATGVTDELPGQMLLGTPFPNPFSDFTQVPLGAVAGPIDLVVRDVTGRVVRRLSRQVQPNTLIRWDGRDANGSEVPAGVYLLSIYLGSTAELRSVPVIKVP